MQKIREIIAISVDILYHEIRAEKRRVSEMGGLARSNWSLMRVGA